jgi:hypothetical protein
MPQRRALEAVETDLLRRRLSAVERAQCVEEIHHLLALPVHGPQRPQNALRIPDARPHIPVEIHPLGHRRLDRDPAIAEVACQLEQQVPDHDGEFVRSLVQFAHPEDAHVAHDRRPHHPCVGDVCGVGLDAHRALVHPAERRGTRVVQWHGGQLDRLAAGACHADAKNQACRRE